MKTTSLKKIFLSSMKAFVNGLVSKNITNFVNASPIIEANDFSVCGIDGSITV